MVLTKKLIWWWFRDLQVDFVKNIDFSHWAWITHMFKRIFIVTTDFLTLENPQWNNSKFKGQNSHLWPNWHVDPESSVWTMFYSQNWLFDTSKPSNKKFYGQWLKLSFLAKSIWWPRNHIISFLVKMNFLELEYSYISYSKAKQQY